MQHSYPVSGTEKRLDEADLTENNPSDNDAIENLPEVFDSSETQPFSGNFRDEIDESRLTNCFRTQDKFAGNPIELEIGSGKGLFLTNMAQKNPERFYIGLELATKYAREAQAKLERLRLTNAVFIACDAVAVMEKFVPDTSLSAVHVYFPDPWWKAKHKKRRVLSDATILNIERALKPKGELHFWTDVLDYYEFAVPRILELTKLQGPFYVPEPTASHSMDYRTHFERRTRLNGLPVYRARFQKKS